MALAMVSDASAGERVVLDPDPRAKGAPYPSRAGNPGERDVGLEDLLRLPDAYSDAGQRRGGANEDVWRSRFVKARKDVTDAEEALQEAQDKLEDMASEGGNWNVATPGSSNETSPLSYKLRSEIRRQRESRERNERELKDLEIEANLASVPESWRR